MHFRWYRAPELLYGARHYDPGVDLWLESNVDYAIHSKCAYTGLLAVYLASY